MAEAVGLGQVDKAREISANMSSRDLVVRMKTFLMKLIDEGQQPHKDWESVRHEADVLAVQIWKQLGSGPSLDRTQRIHPGQKPNAWGFLADYLNFLWMRGVVHQSDLAKEVQDAFPTEDKLSCRIAYLYSESASSVQKLKAIYEDERVGFDLSARAELAALKCQCQLALHQAGGTCAWSKSCYHFHPFSFSLFVIIFCCGFMFILVSQSSLGFRLHFGPQVL